MPRTAAGHGWRPVTVVIIVTLLVELALLAAHPFGTARGYTDLTSIALAPSDADLTGLQHVDGALVLGEDPLRHAGLADGAPSGLAEWQPVPLPQGADAALLHVDAVGAVEVDLRTSPDGTAWSAWDPVVSGGTLSLRGARFLQARALLAGPEDLPARLNDLQLQFFMAEDGDGEQVAATAPQAAPENPTVRLWATREGLVGGRTANGHRIVENDHFVALPSRRVLARDGGNEYQVRLTYKGRQATVPVWDVGPWNTRDNFWDRPADRELFKDLPRFLPQALAAWRDGHNGGRDQYGRWVSFPASIDIADGTYRNDLRMGDSDWVEVTFLWINAPSPPPPPSTPRIYSKPAPSPSPAPTSGTTTAATTAPASPAQPQAPAEPPAGQRWYFAEGSTQAPFQTWLLLQNPHAEPAKATLSFMLKDGSTRTHAVDLAPTSRRSVFVNQVLPDAEFSTRIDSDRPVFAERAMYFRNDGHAATGVQRPEKRWCIADGLTRDGADTWLLVQNPGSQPARANIAFLLEGGGIKRHVLDLPPTSRRSVHTNQQVPNASFAACVESDQPVIVERASYLAGGGGSGGPAVPSLSKTWAFAEGSTQQGARTIIALGNPNSEAATVEITYLPESGGERRKRSVSVPPMGKVAVEAGADMPGTRFGISISASQPVVAERTMMFGPGGVGTHTSAGAQTPARTWYLAEGSTAQPFHEYIPLANPGSTAATVTVDFMREGASVVSRTYPLPAGARLTVDANVEVPNTAVSVRVKADQPIVAERSMYWNSLAGGSSAVGIAWDR
jgi:hypothetical protein